MSIFVFASMSRDLNCLHTVIQEIFGGDLILVFSV